MAAVNKRILSIRVTEAVANKSVHVTQQTVTAVIQAFLDEMSEALASGDTVVIRRFGSFEVREMKARLGRNPLSPENTVKIPAHAGVKFRPGQELKDKVASSLRLIRERAREAKTKAP